MHRVTVNKVSPRVISTGDVANTYKAGADMSETTRQIEEREATRLRITEKRLLLNEWHRIAHRLADRDFELTVEQFAEIFVTFRALTTIGHVFTEFENAIMQCLRERAAMTDDGLEDVEDDRDETNEADEWRGDVIRVA